MKGTLHKFKQTWEVEFDKYDLPSNSKLPIDCNTLQLHPEDIFNLSIKSDKPMDDREGDKVEFEIVDEFSYPHLYEGIGWGDGLIYAKLTHSKTKGYEGELNIQDELQPIIDRHGIDKVREWFNDLKFTLWKQDNM